MLRWHLQRDPRGPDVYFKAWKGVKAIGNFWWLECWRPLARSARVVLCEWMQRLQQKRPFTFKLPRHTNCNLELSSTQGKKRTTLLLHNHLHTTRTCHSSNYVPTVTIPAALRPSQDGLHRTGRIRLCTLSPFHHPFGFLQDWCLPLHASPMEVLCCSQQKCFANCNKYSESLESTLQV